MGDLNQPSLSPRLYIDALDALINNDKGPCRLKGELSLGVQTKDGILWWRAVFGPQVSTEYGVFPRASCTLAVLLSAEAVQAVLAGQTLPLSAEVFYDGEWNFLKRVLGRYCRRQSLVSVRAGAHL